MYLTRNQAWVQAHRGFESLPIRQNMKTKEKNMDIAVLVRLSEDTARDLNKRRADGLSIRGDNCCVHELNNGQFPHGTIQSRVFIVEGVNPKQECEAILGDPVVPERAKGFSVPAFEAMSDEECVVVDFDS